MFIDGERKLVSILVPVYQVENELRQCLESIRNQDFDDWECILVNDCSSDRSGEICREYIALDSRFRLINHECRMGLENVRTTGIRVAKGDYIGFVDSDDWIEPNMFSTLLQKAKELSVDIVACSYYVNYKSKQCALRDGGDVTRYSNVEAIEQLHIMDSKVAPYLWNKLFRRDVLICYETEKENAVGEDYNRNIKAMENCQSVACIDIPLYHYRQRLNSSCNIGYSEERRNSLENYRNMQSYLISKYPRMEEVVKVHYISQAMATLVSMTKNEYYDNELVRQVRSELRAHKRILFSSTKMSLIFRVSAVTFLVSPKMFFFVSKIRTGKQKKNMC